ncbi:MAG: hypothetical protein LBL74_03065 [Bacteroidales bacterium]|nr:hypothetical protein [Bacteroidales bacterium]
MEVNLTNFILYNVCLFLRFRKCKGTIFSLIPTFIFTKVCVGACRTDNIFIRGCFRKIKRRFVRTKQPLVKTKRCFAKIL